MYCIWVEQINSYQLHCTPESNYFGHRYCKVWLRLWIPYMVDSSLPLILWYSPLISIKISTSIMKIVVHLYPRGVQQTEDIERIRSTTPARETAHELHDVSNHRHIGNLFNSLFRLTKHLSSVFPYCGGSLSVADSFHTQRAVMRSFTRKGIPGIMLFIIVAADMYNTYFLSISDTDYGIQYGSIRQPDSSSIQYERIGRHRSFGPGNYNTFSLCRCHFSWWRHQMETFSA